MPVRKNEGPEGGWETVRPFCRCDTFEGDREGRKVEWKISDSNAVLSKFSELDGIIKPKSSFKEVPYLPAPDLPQNSRKAYSLVRGSCSWEMCECRDGFQSVAAELLVFYAPQNKEVHFYGCYTETFPITLSLWFKYILPPHIYALAQESCVTLKKLGRIR